MLAVDVSFLSVPGVSSGTKNFQSITMIAIYMSTLCTVGSLIASVILTGQSRRSGTAVGAVRSLPSLFNVLMNPNNTSTGRSSTLRRSIYQR